MFKNTIFLQVSFDIVDLHQLVSACRESTKDIIQILVLQLYSQKYVLYFLIHNCYISTQEYRDYNLI